MRNPFSAGSWVSGEKFFGRQPLLTNLLQSNEKCDWVIAQRRMGKTSLLRQFEETMNQSASDSLALFWDIQGSYDAKGLQESLEDAIEDSYDLYPSLWDEIDAEILKEEPAPQILKNLSRQLRRRGWKFVLLIDEAEEFLTLIEQNPETLSRLRKTFHACSNMHTIICSTSRLGTLSLKGLIETSPFLHGFHSRFLSNLTQEDVRALAGSGHISTEDADRVFQLTGGNPFQSQLFFKYLFETTDFRKSEQLLQTSPSLAQVHEVNFNLLLPTERDLILKANHNPILQNGEEGNHPSLGKLIQLGFLEQQDGRVSISSEFFSQWLIEYLDSHIDLHPQNESDPLLADSPNGLILENILNIYQFILTLVQEGKRITPDPTKFKISKSDNKIYPHGDEYFQTVRNFDTNQSNWQIAAMDLLELVSKVINVEETWALYRLSEIINQIPKTEESDLLDIMILIREESRVLGQRES